jgi:hypothetical protein
MESHGTPDVARPDAADVARIERMARDLAAELREAPAEDRDELYCYAASLLRDVGTPLEAVPLPGASARPLGAFGLALLLLVAGCMLLLAIPPAGVLVLLASALATIWGVLSVAMSARTRDRAKTRSPRDARRSPSSLAVMPWSAVGRADAWHRPFPSTPASPSAPPSRPSSATSSTSTASSSSRRP